MSLQSDAPQEADIAKAVDFTTAQHGKLDILFNNAAPVGHHGPTHPRAYRLRCASAAIQCNSGHRYAIAPMKAAGGGCIINNSSVAALRYRQGDPLYSALKAAVTHFTRMSGIELGPDNIRVNSISPGAIATPIFWGGSGRANTLSDEDNARKMAKLQQNLARSVPLGKTGLAEDIAEAALYLASEAGRFVNCHDLVVDAGRTSMFNEPAS